MQHTPAFYVNVGWDDDAEVFYVDRSNVPGLNVEAKSTEEMFGLLQSLVPELLEANGVLDRTHDTPAVPYSVMFDQLMANPVDC